MRVLGSGVGLQTSTWEDVLSPAWAPGRRPFVPQLCPRGGPQLTSWPVPCMYRLSALPSLVVTDSSIPLVSHGPEHAAVGLDEFTATVWAPSSTRIQGQGVKALPGPLQDPSPSHGLVLCHTPSLKTILEGSPQHMAKPSAGPSPQNSKHWTTLHRSYRRGRRPVASPGSSSLLQKPPWACSLLWHSATRWGQEGRGSSHHHAAGQGPLLALLGCGLLWATSPLLPTPGFPVQTWAQGSLHEQVTR